MEVVGHDAVSSVCSESGQTVSRITNWPGSMSFGVNESKSFPDWGTASSLVGALSGQVKGTHNRMTSS